VSLPVKEEKRVNSLLYFDIPFLSLMSYPFRKQSSNLLQGSKRASSSVADKPPKKLKKGIIDLTEIDEQVYFFPFVFLFPYSYI
jgi:hypothetical protein